MSKKLAVLFLIASLGGTDALNIARADTSLETYKQANAALRADLAKGNAPKGMSNAAYAKQVAQAFDVGLVEILKRKSAPEILDICADAKKTRAQYLLFGAKNNDLSRVGATAAMQSQNYLGFQDELTAALRFDVTCMASLAGKVDALIAQWNPDEVTPEKREGFQQMQKGMVGIVSGMALSQLDPIRPENRQTLLEVIVRNIDPFTEAMTKQSRRAAAATVARVMTDSRIPRDAKEKLGKVQQSLDRTDCGRSCSFQ